MLTDPILVAVEDEESDAYLLKLAAETAEISDKLLVLRDGQELIDYLNDRTSPEKREPSFLPGLVLLDLKMPRMDGFEVLAWLGQRPQFQLLPVVVFSASTCEADAQKALQLGARDFISKPSQFKTLVETLRSLHYRWLAVSSLQTSSQATKAQPGHKISRLPAGSATD